MQPSRTILTIDDDPDVLEAVETFLNAHEYKVVTAQRWTEAITQLSDASPDAVLLDLHMPTVQGEALLEFIRENHAGLPVVIISAGATPEEMARLGDLGANGFIRKPFDTEDLIVILEQVLLDLEEESRTEPPALPTTEPSAEELVDAEPEVELENGPFVGELLLDTSKTGPSALPSGVSPGSGASNLSRLQPQQQTVRRRRKKKSKPVRKLSLLKKIRNFAIVVLLFLGLGYLTQTFRQGFDTNFIGGISFGASQAE